MKIVKTVLFTIIISLLFIFCTNKKSKKESEINFTNIELIGKWEKGYEKKINNLGLVVYSDIKITYYSNKQTTNILLLKLAEEGEKIIMSVNKLKFEKE